MNLCGNLLIRTAEIIAVGTEILMGQIINSNAAYLARELQNLGIDSHYQTVVGDNPDRLLDMLKLAMSRSDVVILTGGLGPTQDDITMEVAARAVGQNLLLDQEAVTTIESYFLNRKRPMAKSNLKQALLPEHARSIPNYNGTAPGALIPKMDGEKCSCLLVLLPGPPNENQLMFTETVKPLLQEHATSVLDNTFIHMIDIGESDAAEILADLLDDTHTNPSLAPYASTGEVTFRLTEKRRNGQSGAAAQAMLEQVQQRLGTYIYEIGNRSLTEVVADLLISTAQSAAFVESCTAGQVTAELAKVAGVSAVLRGGLCAYQTPVKASVLGVESAVLASFGAISREAAVQMAEKGRALFEADYCVSVSGNAGPDASEGKAVGLVYIAVAAPEGTYAVEFHFRGNRQKIRDNATKQALNQLRKALLGQLSSDY